MDPNFIETRLRAVANTVNKESKYDIVLVGDEVPLSSVKTWIPTKSVLLNLLLGEENFGVPVGKMFELFGEWSHGKSTVAQLMMNGFQSVDGVSNLLDSESGWSLDYALKLGHDKTRHVMLEVDTIESGFGVIKSTASSYITVFNSKVPILYVWDTIAASPTEKEVKDESERMAAKAGIIRERLRVLSRLLPKVPASLVFVNQTIDKIGTPFPMKTTPGGGGIKFWASIRLKVTKVGKPLKDPITQRDIGFTAKVETKKNKLAPPNRSVDIPILWDSGVDYLREVLNYLVDNTVIVNIAGSYKRVENFPEPGKYISFYDNDMYDTARQFPGLYNYLVEETQKHWLGLS